MQYVMFSIKCNLNSVITQLITQLILLILKTKRRKIISGKKKKKQWLNILLFDGLFLSVFGELVGWLVVLFFVFVYVRNN